MHQRERNMTERLTTLMTPSVVPYLKNYLPIMIFFIFAIGLSIALLNCQLLALDPSS